MQRRPKQKEIVLALAAAMAGMAPLAARADCASEINSTEIGAVSWSAGDCTITSSGTITAQPGPGSTGIGLTITGVSVGTLTNNGVIDAYVRGISNSGTIASVVNNGTITSSTGTGIVNDGTIVNLINSALIAAFTGIFNGGSIGTLTNNGTLSPSFSGSYSGINNGTAGTIGTLINALGGVLTGGSAAIHNDGSIGTLTNNGFIGQGNRGIRNNGTIDTLVNGGTIAGYFIGIENNALISTLTNDGTISGSSAAGIYNTGTIGVLTNKGTISASAHTAIYNGGSIGTLSNHGTIGNGSMGIWNSGGTGITVLENAVDGTIQGSSAGIYNNSPIETLTNNGAIKSDNTGIVNFTRIGTLTNGGSIVGSRTGIYNPGTIGTLTNSGTISSIAGDIAGIFNDGTIDTLTNGGSITGGQTGIYSSGTIGALTNSGTIRGVDGVYNEGTIGTLTNSGSIGGTGFGIRNTHNGTGITEVINAAGSTITGGRTGILNDSTIGTLTNSGFISSSVSSGGAGIVNSANATGMTALTNAIGGIITGSEVGVFNNVRIETLTNNGVISGGVTGIYTDGAIGTLTNGGTIHGGNVSGIFNYGSIGKLTNSGTISGSQTGIGNGNAATIDTLINSRTIGSDNTGLANGGSIGTLTNTGTISGAVYAFHLYPTGTIGSINNAGVIAGNILNASSADLAIDGGTGSQFGTLTGFGGTIGAITNTGSNVSFGSGNLVLNDNIDVGGNAVNNTGTAVLEVRQPVIIAGNYNQGASATLQIGVAGGATTQGTISSDAGYGRLVVTGTSTIASGSSVSLKSNGYAFANGQRYVVVDTAGAANYNHDSLRYSAHGFGGTVTGNTVDNGGKSDLVLFLDGAPNTPPPVTPPTNTPPTDTPPSDPPPTGSAPTDTPPAGTPPSVTPSSSPIPAGISPNASAALGGLLGYTGISSPDLLNLYNAALGSLSQGSAATANRIGKQLTPIQTGWAPVAATFDALNVVGAHVNALRLGQANGTGIATGEGPAQWGAWGQAYGGHASQNERDQVDGYSANYGGLLLGLDKAINDNWRAGGVFSYSNTQVNNTGDTSGDKTRVDSYGLIGYASYTGRPWYVNLSGAVVQQQYNTTRRVDFQGFSGSAKGDFSGQQYVARAEAGYPLALGDGGLVLTPLASVTYSYLDQGSYTESGGNGAALSVGRSHASSVRSGLGAKLAKSFSSRYGEVVPEVQLHWIHEYSHTRQVTGAGFAADPGGQTAFTSVGATPVSNLADLTLGVTVLRSNNLSLSVGYELQAGSGFVSQTGALRLRKLF